MYVGCSLCGVGCVVMFPLWCRVCGHVPSVVWGVWSCSLCGVGCVVMFPLWCRGGGGVCGHVPSVV